MSLKIGYASDTTMRRLVAKESLILEATEAISEAMEKRGMNQTELAQKINRTKAQVSQVLSGRNVTLKTIALMLDALDCEARILLVPREEKGR